MTEYIEINKVDFHYFGNRNLKELFVRDACVFLTFYLHDEFVVVTCNFVDRQQELFDHTRFTHHVEEFVQVLPMNTFKYLLYNNFPNSIENYMKSIYMKYCDHNNDMTYYYTHQILLDKYESQERRYDKYKKSKITTEAIGLDKVYTTYEYSVNYGYLVEYKERTFRYQDGRETDKKSFVEEIVKDAIL